MFLIKKWSFEEDLNLSCYQICKQIHSGYRVKQPLYKFCIPKLKRREVKNAYVQILSLFESVLLAQSSSMWYLWLYFTGTVKPVCNDHLYDKIYYLWFIQ